MEELKPLEVLCICVLTRMPKTAYMLKNLDLVSLVGNQSESFNYTLRDRISTSGFSDSLVGCYFFIFDLFKLLDEF